MLYLRLQRQQRGWLGSGALQGSLLQWSACAWPCHTWVPGLQSTNALHQHLEVQ